MENQNFPRKKLAKNVGNVLVATAKRKSELEMKWESAELTVNVLLSKNPLCRWPNRRSKTGTLFFYAFMSYPPSRHTTYYPSYLPNLLYP